MLCGRMTFSPMAYKIRGAIDGAAEVVADDRKRLHQVGARTPGPDLPPVKWRTVE